jgi:hypothetical protein
MQRGIRSAAAAVLAICAWFTNPAPAGAQGVLAATPPQLRACRSEADRRLPDYTWDDIQVVSEGRDQNVADVRWSAGNIGGECTVATNGRVLSFTRDASYGSSPAGTTRVTCESRRTDRQECHIPTGSRIRLVRQISDNPCRMNDTYGQGAGYIWVAEGCRGEFEVTLPSTVGPGGVTRITCASPNNTRQECRFPGSDRARFIAQAGRQQCRVNDTFGWTNGGVWVDRGCQAIFEVSGSGSYTTRMTCESQGAARQQCAIAGATAIRLARQTSANPCRLNDTYGIGFGYIWVSSGCRGDFDVTVGGSTSTGTWDRNHGAHDSGYGHANDGNGTYGNGNYGNGTNGRRNSGNGTYDNGLPTTSGLPDRVTCESTSGQKTECRIRDGAQMQGVQLIKQTSTAACTKYITWGVAPGVLWVDKGCRGEFEVR